MVKIFPITSSDLEQQPLMYECPADRVIIRSEGCLLCPLFRRQNRAAEDPNMCKDTKSFSRNFK